MSFRCDLFILPNVLVKYCYVTSEHRVVTKQHMFFSHGFCRPGVWTWLNLVLHLGPNEAVIKRHLAVASVGAQLGEGLFLRTRRVITGIHILVAVELEPCILVECQL